uniref:Uncharacterized protein n=1 Tax=Oryza barthii TaxID=65489 RepID=A0A0D3GEG6_9ORYZ
MWIDKNGDAFPGEEFPVVISTAVSCEKAEQAESNEGIKLSSLSDIDQEVAAGKGEESGVGPGDTADGDVARGCRPT